MNDPSAHRPICSISAFGKLFEYLVRGRLEAEIENNGGLSNDQYGFRQGRSTIAAIEEVSVRVESSDETWVVLIADDIRNAFNTATWSLMIEELKRRGVAKYVIYIVADYFRNRIININKRDRFEVTMGVPQGSALGPTLWNIFYDGVLGIELADGAYRVTYFDELAILIQAKNEAELIFRAEESMNRIKSWIKLINLN